MRSSFRLLPAALAAGCCALGLVGRAAGQDPPSESRAYRLQQTRAGLESRLQQLQELATAQQFKALSPDSVRAETTYIRQRLTDGDFSVGDRVLVSVEDPAPPLERPNPATPKSPEQQLSDTFTVGPGQQLTLPVVGVVSLHGVLRTELEARLTEEIARYVRDPVVHARALVGLGLTGELTHPGYYSVPTDAVIPTVLMAASGTTRDAKLNDLKILRNGRTVWHGDALRRALAAGRTVDDLELQPGDVIVVPRARQGQGIYQPVYLLSVVLGIPVTIYTLTKIIHPN